MKNLLMKYVLLLATVLFMGHSTAFANTADSLAATTSRESFSNNPKQYIPEGLITIHYFYAAHIGVTVEKENQRIGITDNEETEEEDFKISHKEFTKSALLTQEIATQNLSYLYNSTTKSVCFNTHYVYIPSNRLHVIFRVFRI